MARDFRKVLEAQGIHGRVLDEYRHDVRLEADGENEFRLAGPIVSDEIRSWYGEGEAVSPGEMNAWLKECTGDITVRVNSPGGNVFAGVEILNQLRSYDGNVKMQIVGLAASAASVIAMAGDEIEMGTAALMMIHRSSCLALGNSIELRAMANRLELIDGEVAKVYSARCGKDPDEMLEMMTSETWFGADSAIETGMADRMMGDDGKETEAESESENQDEAEEETAKADEVRQREFAVFVARLAVLNQ